jgi:nucleotide-binding universal stress UspA family protein
VFELGTDGPRRILVGVDGSENSLRAGSYAAGLARRQGSELVAVHVTQPRLGVAAAVAATAGVVLPAENDACAEELKRMAYERAADVGIRVVFLHRSGSPYDELVAVADELRVDAIVVGASHRGGGRVVGTLAARLVHEARWPVTVVP